MKTVLLIDDDEDIRFIVDTILNAAEDFTCHTASNRQEGVRLAQSLRPDLILLDVVLGTDRGEEVYQDLRSREETRPIPIVFLTGSTRPEDNDRLLRLGAAGLIAKPFQPDHLIDTLRSYLA
ncbi:MAG: response regulator [Candidatus Neomarinimicrobiota bacterium]|nr:MAG: response regulator [Candidatus Neomarinimicrobiota bacterium]